MGFVPVADVLSDIMRDVPDIPDNQEITLDNLKGFDKVEHWGCCANVQVMAFLVLSFSSWVGRCSWLVL